MFKVFRDVLDLDCCSDALQTDQRSEGVRIRAVAYRPCVFRKLVAGKMEAILVLLVDDLLALTVTNEVMETFVEKCTRRSRPKI